MPRKHQENPLDIMLRKALVPPTSECFLWSFSGLPECEDWAWGEEWNDQHRIKAKQSSEMPEKSMSPHRPFISIVNLLVALINDSSVIHRVTYKPGAHPALSLGGACLAVTGLFLKPL